MLIPQVNRHGRGKRVLGRALGALGNNKETSGFRAEVAEMSAMYTQSAGLLGLHGVYSLALEMGLH